MPRIKGPNGLVLPVSDDLAAALLRHPEGEYELVEEAKGAAKPSSEKPAKKAAAKPSSEK